MYFYCFPFPDTKVCVSVVKLVLFKCVILWDGSVVTAIKALFIVVYLNIRLSWENRHGL